VNLTPKLERGSPRETPKRLGRDSREQSWGTKSGGTSDINQRAEDGSGGARRNGIGSWEHRAIGPYTEAKEALGKSQELNLFSTASIDRDQRKDKKKQSGHGPNEDSKTVHYQLRKRETAEGLRCVCRRRRSESLSETR